MASTGETLARALEWVLRSLQDNPKADKLKLIEEASQRYDLSPLDSDWLIREVNKATKPPAS